MPSLTQYITWAERQMAGVITSEGLHVGLAAVVQGPLTLTYRLRLLTPSRAELQKLLTLGPTIAQALQCARVRVIDGADGVLVEVPSPAPRTPTAAELAKSTQGAQRVCVGLDAYRKPVYLDFTRTPHALAVGPTRRGKSEAVKSLLYGLASRTTPAQVVCVILAKKRADWAAFAPWAGCLGIFSDDREIAAALTWLAGDLLQRRTHDGVHLPHVFIVLDDLANLVARADIGATLAEIASMGGGAGVHLIISTQTTGRAGGLSAALEANLTARLVFGASDAAAAARFAGSGGSGAGDVGTIPGDCLLVLDGTPQRVATGLSDDRLISLLPTAKGPHVLPWQNHREPAEPHRTTENRLHPTPTGEDIHPLRGGIPAEPVTEPVTGYDLGAPITDAERDAAQRLRADGASMNQTCITLYGHKNGRTWGRLHDALQAHQTPTETPTPSEIDLTTEEGRAALAELQRAGLVHLPSTKELLQ